MQAVLRRAGSRLMAWRGLQFVRSVLRCAGGWLAPIPAPCGGSNWPVRIGLIAPKLAQAKRQGEMNMTLLKRIFRHTSGSSLGQWLIGILLLTAVLPLLAIHNAYAALACLSLAILLLLVPFSMDMIMLASALVFSQQWPEPSDRRNQQITGGRSKMIYGLLLMTFAAALFHLGLQN